MRIGFHASHEQHPPGALLELVQRAEASGFEAAMCSDHLSPWSERQGQSGFAWSWLGAALQATQLSFGCVTAPGYRYHPAVVAQGAATLAEMYPGRFWVALGSGELLNEHVTGEAWPSDDERRDRLHEAAQAIRGLLAGEEVSTSAGRIDRARVWVRPRVPPRLIGAALSEDSAGRAASWADGLIIAPSDAGSAERLIRAFREAGGTGPVSVQFVLSYADSEEQALAEAADQWRQVALEPGQLAELSTPEEFDRATASIGPGDVRERVLVTADPKALRSAIEQFANLDVDTIYLHNVCRDQAAFLSAMQHDVLPAVERGKPVGTQT